MADATNKIAADETFRTTDGNDTNLADLMQSGLASIATAIGAIPALDAANITYDNSTSGLSASYVSTAIDELASEKADSATTLAGYGITDAYTKAQTDAKITALDYSDTAVSGSYVTEVDETDGVISVTREAADASPTSSSSKMVTSGGVYTALAAKQDTLTAGTGIDISSNTISVDATASEITFDDTSAGLGVSNTQDAIDALNNALTQKMTYADNGLLGAKNLLPMVLSDIKAANTSGTWSDNVYSYNGIDFTINTDNDGNVTGIVADGTASSSIELLFSTSSYKSGTYILNGCPANGSYQTYNISTQVDGTWMTSSYDYGNGSTIECESTIKIAIAIRSGVTASSLTFYPMIRLATDTDSTFQPYAKTNLQLTADLTNKHDVYFTSITVDVADTSIHYLGIDKPLEGTVKSLIPVCIAPVSNADVRLELWVQGMNSSTTRSSIRYKASTASSYTYTILLTWFY